MATEMTASAASGTMTDCVFDLVGSKRVFRAHYSSPSADTQYILLGFQGISFVDVQDADPTTYSITIQAPGVKVEFSGLVTGSTGFIQIVSQ